MNRPNHSPETFGYPKNERANVTERELEALRLLAKELLGYSEPQLITL